MRLKSSKVWANPTKENPMRLVALMVLLASCSAHLTQGLSLLRNFLKVASVNTSDDHKLNAIQFGSVRYFRDHASGIKCERDLRG